MQKYTRSIEVNGKSISDLEQNGYSDEIQIETAILKDQLKNGWIRLGLVGMG